MQLKNVSAKPQANGNLSSSIVAGLEFAINKGSNHGSFKTYALLHLFSLVASLVNCDPSLLIKSSMQITSHSILIIFLWGMLDWE